MRTLSGFLALRPVLENDQLNALARDCVTDLDRFRAPAAADELASRRRAGLTVRQDMLLLRYGYPYVLEEFRFHLTLTEPLDATESAALRGPLSEHFCAALRQPAHVDAVCLCEQDCPGTAFRLTHRYAFGAP